MRKVMESSTQSNIVKIRRNMTNLRKILRELSKLYENEMKNELKIKKLVLENLDDDSNSCIDDVFKDVVENSKEKVNTLFENIFK